MSNHDENKDVRLLSKIAKINPANKSIRINANQIIGNKRWGRIDFLCNYCGYHLVKEDGTVASVIVDPEKTKRNKKEEFKKKSNSKMLR